MTNIDKTIQKGKRSHSPTTFVHAIQLMSDMGAPGVAAKANETLEQMRQDVVFNRAAITPKHLRLMCIAGGIGLSSLFHIDAAARTAIPTGTRLSDTATEQKADIWSRVVRSTQGGSGAGGGEKRRGGVPTWLSSLFSTPAAPASAAPASAAPASAAPASAAPAPAPAPVTGTGGGTPPATTVSSSSDSAATRDLATQMTNLMEPAKENWKGALTATTLALVIGALIGNIRLGGLSAETKAGISDLKQLLQENNVPNKYYLKMNKFYPNITHSALQVLTKQEFDDLMTDIEIDSRNRKTVYARVYLDKSERVRKEQQQVTLEQLQTRVDEVSKQEKGVERKDRVLTNLLARRDLESEFLVRDIPYDFFTDAKKATFRPAKLNRLLRQKVSSPDSFFSAGYQKFTNDEIEAVHRLYYNIAPPAPKERSPFRATPNELSSRSVTKKRPAAATGNSTFRQVVAAQPSPEANDAARLLVTATNQTMGKADQSRVLAALSTLRSILALPAGVMLYLWMSSSVFGKALSNPFSGSSANPTFSQLYNSPHTHKTIGKDPFHIQRGDYNGLLAGVDTDLHNMFTDYHKNRADEVNRLRYQLLRVHQKRSQEEAHLGGGHHYDRDGARAILPFHLFRPDGSPRDSPLEIALAIKHHTHTPSTWSRLKATVGHLFGSRAGPSPAAQHMYTRRKRSHSSVRHGVRQGGAHNHHRRSSKRCCRKRPHTRSSC
jgi:hypothetical protein